MGFKNIGSEVTIRDSEFVGLNQIPKEEKERLIRQQIVYGLLEEMSNLIDISEEDTSDTLTRSETYRAEILAGNKKEVREELDSILLEMTMLGDRVAADPRSIRELRDRLIKLFYNPDQE